MCAKTRKAVRYEVVGRVESDELSAFPGTILDLSIKNNLQKMKKAIQIFYRNL